MAKLSIEEAQGHFRSVTRHCLTEKTAALAETQVWEQLPDGAARVLLGPERKVQIIFTRSEERGIAVLMKRV